MENQKDNQNDLQKLDITINQSEDKIGHCDKHGEYPLKKFQGLRGEIKYIGSCQLCIDEEHQKKSSERTQHKISSLKKFSNIPERFKLYTFKDFKNDNHQGKVKIIDIIEKYVKNFDDNLNKGRSMIILGPPGTGKTMIAACIINSIIEKSYCKYEYDENYGEKQLKEYDFFAHYITEYELFRKIKNTWSEKIETEDRVINRYCDSCLLIIDEIGVSFGSEADKILFYQVINGRYEKSLPTVLMSNLNLQDLTKHCGERIMDRMKENDGINLLFNWSSYRK
jgi:DNA replication protein DnaC